MEASRELRDDIRRAAANRGQKTQAELATVLGLSPQYLADILRCRRRLTPDLVRKAADVLAVHTIRARRWQRLGAIESGWDIG